MGEFNAHLRKEERKKSKSIIVGNLFHSKNNEKGNTLNNLALLFRVKIVTTMAKEKSALAT